MKRYDLIVIGGGAAGLVAAAGAAGLGAKTALADPNPLGGDCLWTGCVPTKSLIHSAKLVHSARMASSFGLDSAGKPDFSIAVKRLQEAIRRVQHHDDPERFRNMGIDLYENRAVFAGPHEIILDDSQRIWGKRIVIATGTRPLIPPIEGLEEAGYLTNETALSLNRLPSSLIVLGGGPIGLELAQSFARFGADVTVVEMAPEILGKEDLELIPYVKQGLEGDGIRIRTGAKVVRVLSTGADKEVVVEQGGTTDSLKAEAILVAAGRRPNTEGLGLEAAGVVVQRGAIPVNRRLQTNRSHIYAIGDVNGMMPFTHAAGYEGKTAVANAVLGLRQKVDYSHLPWVTFTDPELFHLGWTEEEARQQVSGVQVFKTELEQVDRFAAEGVAGGLVKVVTDRRGKILGAHAVGPGAGDWMQEMVFAKRYKHRIGSLSQVIHPYPTRAGALQTVADGYWRKKLFAGWIPAVTRAYVRWFR